MVYETIILQSLLYGLTNGYYDTQKVPILNKEKSTKASLSLIEICLTQTILFIVPL